MWRPDTYEPIEDRAVESLGIEQALRGAEQVVVVTTFGLLATVLIMILEKDYKP